MPQPAESTPRRRKPAHRAKPSFRTRFISISGILASTAIIGVGALAGLAGTGETYAFWNGSEKVAPATFTSGDMTVQVGNASNWSTVSTAFSIDTNGVGYLFPGEFAQAPDLQIWLSGAGTNLKADVSVRTAIAVPSGFEMNVKPGLCPGTPSAPVIVSGYAVSNSDVLLGTWNAGDKKPICAQLSVPQNAPSASQGTASGKIEFIITAKQKQP